MATYNGALSGATIASQFNEGIAALPNDMRTVYDTVGNPTSSSGDTYLANPGFEYGNGGTYLGWTLGTGGSISNAAAHGGIASLALAAGGSASAVHTVRLVPGHAFRFQFCKSTVAQGVVDCLNKARERPLPS